MIRADLVHALALLPRAESIAVLLDADRERDGMEDRALNVEDARVGVIYSVADAYCVDPAALIGRGQSPTVCRARKLAYVLLADLLDMSTPQIGRLMDGRDHSTVIRGMRDGRDDDSPMARRARDLAVGVVMRAA